MLFYPDVDVFENVERLIILGLPILDIVPDNTGYQYRRLRSRTGGLMRQEVLDCSSGDAIPASVFNSKTFRVDKDGIVKVEYRDSNGNPATKVMQVYAGVDFPADRISRVYRYFTGSSATGYAQVFKADGTLTNGIAVQTSD